jgi:hypothetical protein
VEKHSAQIVYDIFDLFVFDIHETITNNDKSPVARTTSLPLCLIAHVLARP